MEIDTSEENQEKLIEAVLDKELGYRQFYHGQINNLLINKWKSEIVKKYGKGG